MPRYTKKCTICIRIPIIILDFLHHAASRFTILRPGQTTNPSSTIKPTRPSWRWLPGGWTNYNITLEDLYLIWQAGWGTWSAGNLGYDLVRYFGCKIIFYPDQVGNFIVSCNPNVKGTDYNLWSERSQPMLQLMEKTYKKLILSKQDAPQRRKLPKMWVPRPSHLNSGWYKTNEICQETLLCMKASCCDINQTWFDTLWANRGNNQKDPYLPYQAHTDGGTGTNQYSDGYPGTQYDGYCSGWTIGPAKWAGGLVEEKVTETTKGWDADYYTSPGFTGSVYTDSTNGMLRYINSADGPYMQRTIHSTNGIQLTAKICFYFQWGSNNHYPEIEYITDPCRKMFPTLPGAQKGKPQMSAEDDWYTIRSEDEDELGILTDRGYRRLIRDPNSSGHRRRTGYIRGRHHGEPPRKKAASDFSITSASEEEDPFS